MRNLIISLFYFFCISILIQHVQAVNFVNMDDKSALEHGTRKEAAGLLYYDVFENKNHLILYGGRGYNPDTQQEEFMDPLGDIWRACLYHLGNNEDALEAEDDIIFNRHPLADFFRLTNQTASDPYCPKGRFGHSAIILPSQDLKILHNDNQDQIKKPMYMNLLVFGGKKQVDSGDMSIANNTEVTNEIWISADYQIQQKRNGKITFQDHRHWFRFTEPADPSVWPEPCYNAQMIPLFNEETPLAERNSFLLFGGRDSNGGLINKAYIGTFTRTTTPVTGTSNEWEFALNLTITFSELTPRNEFQVSGASVLYDPFYGTDQSGNRTPRVIIIGGERLSGTSSEVFCMYPDNNNWMSPIFTQEFPDLDKSRTHAAAVLNPRDHRIRVFGGQNTDSIVTPVLGIEEFKITDLTPVWHKIDNTFNADHHNAVYSNGTRIYQQVGTGSNSQWKVIWDHDERSRRLEKPDSHKIWNVSIDGIHGFDTLESIVNTPRLHPWDIIRVHQSKSISGKVNDCYLTNICVPSWCPDILIEGVVKNGVKPVLYNLYDTGNRDGQIWIDPISTEVKFDRDMKTVFYIHSNTTVKNLHIAHFSSEMSPENYMPTEIPLTNLENYMDEDDPLISWDLAYHHVEDPGIFVHAPFHFENCDFSRNGVGIVLICVSSAITQAKIKSCNFSKNHIGLLSLETEHIIQYNTFTENYLAGVAFDKGARAVFSENYFKNNGRLGEQGITGFDNIEAAILSCFASSWSVPLIQTPFIFNNTFIENKRTLSIYEPGDRSQYSNRPVFFNNIVSDTRSTALEPVFIKSSQRRCDLICQNNCFDLLSGVNIFDIQDLGVSGYLTMMNIEADPWFSNDYYQVHPSSPAVDAGLYTLNPGVSSEWNYSDTGIQDIGYHFLPLTGNQPSEPDNISIDNQVVTWDPPTNNPDGYLVQIETHDETLVEQAFVSNGSTPEYDFGEITETHLWIGVRSHYNRQTFSPAIWIEWIE